VGELRLLEKRRQFQEDDPKLVPPDAKSGNDKAAAETKSGSEHRLARADAFDPAPKHCRGKSEKKNGETENPRERGLRPIIRRGLGNTYDFGERQFENAERVDLADGKVDGQRCGRKKASDYSQDLRRFVVDQKSPSKVDSPFEAISDVTIKIFVVSFCYVSVS